MTETEARNEIKKSRADIKSLKKRISELEIFLASKTEMRLPRLARNRSFYDRNEIQIVFGKITPETEWGFTKWKSKSLRIEERRLSGLKSGAFLFDRWDDAKNLEPDWISEEEELEICLNFAKSKWAKQILKARGINP